MFKELTPDDFNKFKGGEHWITVTEGMSGFFAVEMWLNDQDLDFNFPEPWDTGIGRYPCYEFAKQEALNMAKDLDLPFWFQKEKEKQA